MKHLSSGLQLVFFIAALVWGVGCVPAKTIPIGVIEVEVGRYDEDVPVSGATLAFDVIPGDGARYTRAVVTGEDGVGRVDLGGSLIREIACRVECAGFLSVATRWPFSEIHISKQDAMPTLRSSVRLVPRKQKLSGTVVDAQMQGISGVTVLLDYFHRGLQGEQYGELPFSGFSETIRLMTDDQGRWETDAWVSPRGKSVRMRFLHPDYVDHGDPSEPDDPKMEEIPWWMWDQRGKVSFSDFDDLLLSGEGVTVMSGGFGYTGQVLDDSGSPVGAADVALFAPLVSPRGDVLSGMRSPEVRVRTDDDGRFEIGNTVVGLPLIDRESAESFVSNYKVSVVAASKGLSLGEHSVPYFSGGEKTAVFRLETGNLFEGEVVDRSGDPIPGVSVSIDSSHQATGEGWGGSIISGPNGRFVWPYGLRGEFVIHLRWMVDETGFILHRQALETSPNLGPIEWRNAEYPISLPRSTVERFVLDERVQLAGTVKNGHTGEPVPEFEVRMVAESVAGQEGSVELARVDGRSGEYSLQYPQGYDHHTLSVLVSGEGFLTTRAGPNNPKNIPNPLHVSLWPAATIEGIVVDQESRPVSGAIVQRIVPGRPAVVNLTAGGDGDGKSLGFRSFDPRGLFPFLPEYTRTESKSDGSFVLGDRPIQYDQRPVWWEPELPGFPEHLRKAHEQRMREASEGPLVVFAAEGFAIVHPGELELDRVIPLQAHAELSVKLREGAVAAAFRRVDLSRVTEEGEFGLNVRVPVTTDAGGVARFEGLIPGTYRIGVGSAIGAGRMDTRGQVRVEAGQSKVIEIGGGGQTLRGHLVSDADRPAVDWSKGRLQDGRVDRNAHSTIETGLFLLREGQLSGSTGSRRAVWPDADGHFSVTGVVPGRYQFRYLVTGAVSNGVGPEGRRARGREQPNRFMGMMIDVRETILPRLSGPRYLPVLLHGERLYAYIDQEVIVPDAPSETVVDMGDLSLRWAHHPTVGKVAPEFSGLTNDGEALFHSQSLAGQQMVVVFGNGGMASDRLRSFLGQALEAQLKETVLPALVSALLVDSPNDFQSPRIKDGVGPNWREVYVGAWDHSKAAMDFGVLCVPMFFVIGPDGVVQLSSPDAAEVLRWFLQDDGDDLRP